jgi:hypothetical protein
VEYWAILESEGKEFTLAGTQSDPTSREAGGVAGREPIGSAFADWRETYGALSNRMHCLTPPGYS